MGFERLPETLFRFLLLFQKETRGVHRTPAFVVVRTTHPVLHRFFLFSRAVSEMVRAEAPKFNSMAPKFGFARLRSGRQGRAARQEASRAGLGCTEEHAHARNSK